jgi:hypothetical protein
MNQDTTNQNLQTLNLIMQKLRSNAEILDYYTQQKLKDEHESVLTDISASNDLVYVDEDEICLKTDLCERLYVKDQTLSIESVRFFTTRHEEKIDVYAGVNICIRPELPKRLQISNSLKYEFPEEERRAFNRDYGEIRWHQDAFFDATTIEEVADKLIETFIEVSRQW